MLNFPVRELKENTVIFEEGSFGSAAYILKQGRVEIFTQIGGKEFVLAELSPITIFGEMALLTAEQKRTATARTVGPVELIEIDKENFDILMSDSPSIITTILHAITYRLADTTEQLYHGRIKAHE